MKATGIVRRIDDLGRIVIPKEIRRNLRIREGTPLEIFVDREGGVILKKYSIVGRLEEFAQEYADSLHQSLGHLALICDQDTVVAVSGGAKKEFLNKKLDATIRKVMENREPLLINDNDDPYFEVIAILDETERYRSFPKVISPIIFEGDAIGAVILMPKDQGVKLGDIELKMTQTAAGFLAKQMES
ncbi:MAG: stage V sporulation protein T [Firmicutes bacterium]|nr:stage V sporulation protein T [Bacillota bacterium]